MEEMTAKVVAIKNYEENGTITTQLLRVKPERPVSHVPGQFAMLAHKDFKLRQNPDAVKWSSYSICSGSKDSDLEFIYTVKRTGGFTEFLSKNLKEGDTLLIKAPFGNFVLQDNQKEKIFVCTGAGIAPFMSMIRELSDKGFSKDMLLFFGFRTGKQFLYREELEQIAQKPNTHLFTTISREDPSWEGHHGYVQELLKNHQFKPQDQEVYICGNPKMVDQVKEILHEKGFADSDIYTEKW